MRKYSRYFCVLYLGSGQQCLTIPQFALDSGELQGLILNVIAQSIKSSNKSHDDIRKVGVRTEL